MNKLIVFSQREQREQRVGSSFYLLFLGVLAGLFVHQNDLSKSKEALKTLFLVVFVVLVVNSGIREAQYLPITPLRPLRPQRPLRVLELVGLSEAHKVH